MLAHGGNLSAAADEYGIPEEQWLDLSTGLNPNAWELNSPIPSTYLTRLPYPDDQLQAAATNYYGTPNILPVAGSQAVIQALPTVVKTYKVAVPAIGYEEHRYHWQKNGHQLQSYNPYQDDLLAIAKHDQPSVILVINPNNPTGHLHDRKVLLQLLNIVEGYGGLLIIDEAFIDTRPHNSLSSISSDSLIILRSIGKFFGLPGIRTGFVIARQHWLDKIESALGPWALSGPSQWIATQCLNDKGWQQQAIKSLKLLTVEQAAMLSNELKPFGIEEANSTDYFISFIMNKNIAEQIKTHFGENGILVRSIELDTQRSLLRFGLCANSDAVARVKKAASSFLLA